MQIEGDEGMARSSAAASMVLAGIPLGDPPAMTATIETLCVAGIRAFLLPGGLLGEPELLSGLSASAQRAAAAAGLGRALVALGGSFVPAFGQPFFPAALTALGLAALGSRPAARRSGRALGEALAACGIDLLLGPRLDLAVDPKDPAGILDRFGEDPAKVGTYASAFIRGLRASGVESCVGRFPGLGSAITERAEGLAIVDLPAERLASVEMRPYASAARAGAAAVLVGRTLVPSLEPGRIPAARSSRVIEGRLREGFGFKGLVIGDEAHIEHEIGGTVLLGALAGCDLTLYGIPSEAERAAKALEEAVAEGRLPAARVASSMRRLDRFLASRNGPPRARAGSADLDRGRERIERDRAASLSILKGDFLRRPEPSLVLVFLPPEDSPESSEIPAVMKALEAALPETELVALPADPSPADAQGLMELLSAHGAELAASSAAALTYDAHFRPAQEGLARLVEESVRSFSVIAMRDPYDAAFFPRAYGLAAAYGFTVGAAKAVARLLKGSVHPVGECPVGVLGLEV